MSEDWDGPAVDHVSKSFDGQFKSAFTIASQNQSASVKGLGRGRGFATKLIQEELPVPQFSYKPAINSNDDDDGWNEGSSGLASWNNNGPAPVSKFDSNSGTDFTQNNSNTSSFGFNNFGSQNDRRGNDRQGGGRGGGNTGKYQRKQFKSSLACFKCGEEGHMSRNCPSGGSGDGGGRGAGNRSQGGRACFKCNQEGHMSRNCPEANGQSKSNGDSGNSYFGGFGGGNKNSFDDNKENDGGFSFGSHNDDDAPRGGGSRGSKSCFKCGETGHMSRECPSSTTKDGCFKCGESGHMSRECPNSVGGSGSGSKDCFKCGESGHMSRECPKSGGSSKGCFKCGESGHMSRECTNSTSSGAGSGSKDCFKCGESGHMSRECPKSGGSKGCFKCGEEGHMSKDCTSTATTTPDGKPIVEKYIPPTQPDDEQTLFESVPMGINFLKYDNIPVQLSDNTTESLPLSKYEMMQFQTSGLHEQLIRNILKSSYTKPTPVQKHSIPIIRQHRDLMACAQTGSGKTAAFLLPIMSSILEEGLPLSSKCNPYVLILVPTRELAIQTRREAQKFAYNTGIRAVEVYGGVSSGHQRSQIELGCNILIATIGRLKDFLTRRVITLDEVKFLVLDEADRMLEQKGFKNDVLEIINERGLPPKESRLSLMFSATFPREVQHLAKEFLNNYFFLSVGTIGSANQDVTQHFYQLSQFEKRDKLVEILSEAGTDRTMVFVEQKRTADFIASYLCQNSFPTTSIHGDRLQRERELALSDFRRGESTILIATNVAARGLDIRDVKHVINYDLPSEMQDYVHRIGRTGRVGNLGKSTSFYDSAVDASKAADLIKIIEEANQVAPDWLKAEGGGDSYGGSGFVGRFAGGSSDIRGPRKTYDNGNDFGSSSSASFGLPPPSTSNADDEWD